MLTLRNVGRIHLPGHNKGDVHSNYCHNLRYRIPFSSRLGQRLRVSDVVRRVSVAAPGGARSTVGA